MMFRSADLVCQTVSRLVLLPISAKARPLPTSTSLTRRSGSTSYMSKLGLWPERQAIQEARPPTRARCGEKSALDYPAPITQTEHGDRPAAEQASVCGGDGEYR